jgi:hypothetical protein
VSAADLEALDRLGAELVRFGGESVMMKWDGLGYHVDWVDEAGLSYTGYGPKPSAAVAAGKRWAEMKRAERAKAVAHA